MSLQIPDMETAFFDLLGQIPAGRVTTYGAIATALGDLKAARWVGTIALHHTHNHAERAACNCHRIARSDGSLGGYVTGDGAQKATLLANEGSLLDSGKANLGERFFGDFDCDQPLRALRQHQSRMAHEVRLEPHPVVANELGGVDISYRDNVAYATYVCVGGREREPVWHETISMPVEFPYISSYLAFRELPVCEALIERVRRSRELPAITVVDGSGVLHPRRCGIATMLGVSEEMTTIGVTKKRLVGRFSEQALSNDGSASVTLDGQPAGVVTYGRSASKKPLYISPGNAIDVQSAADLIQQFWGHRRLPAAVYWADRISRAASRAG